MNYRKFYSQLFVPVEALLGPIDRDTLVAIVGFDAGGPLNFRTIGRAGGKPCITYLSCELAVREEQQPSEFGRYELLATCDDMLWVRAIVSDIGRMSLETKFGDGHTLDIGPWVPADAPIQGVLFEEASRCFIGDEPFGVLRVIGVSRSEMEYAQQHGASALLDRLKAEGIYPCTIINRASVV